MVLDCTSRSGLLAREPTFHGNVSSGSLAFPASLHELHSSPSCSSRSSPRCRSLQIGMIFEQPPCACLTSRDTTSSCWLLPSGASSLELRPSPPLHQSPCVATPPHRSAVRRGAARRHTCSVLVVPPHLDGFLHSGAMSLLHLTTGPGVHHISLPPDLPWKSKSDPALAPRGAYRTLRSLPSSTAALCHHSRCPLVVSAFSATGDASGPCEQGLPSPEERYDRSRIAPPRQASCQGQARRPARHPVEAG